MLRSLEHYSVWCVWREDGETCLSDDVVPSNDVSVTVMQLSVTGLVQQIMVKFHDMPDVNALSDNVNCPSNSLLKSFPK